MGSENKLDRALRDVKKRQAAIGASLGDSPLASELRSQLYPMLESIIVATKAEIEEAVAELGEDIDELDSTVGLIVDQSSDVLHKSTGETILSALQTARSVAAELATAAAAMTDELAKKRLSELAERSIQQFADVEALVSSITLSETDADPDDKGDDDDEEDSDG